MPAPARDGVMGVILTVTLRVCPKLPAGTQGDNLNLLFSCVAARREGMTHYSAQGYSSDSGRGEQRERRKIYVATEMGISKGFKLFR